MHLILLLSLYFMYHALGSPSDILYLQKLNADEAQILDRKDFGALANVFTKNATLNVGIGENVYGIEAIQATIAAILPPTNISQFAITTQNYELLPPFDEQGAAGTATGVVYTTAAVIGQGNFSGQAIIGFARFEDKYVKTSNFTRYGGWRISERLFKLFGPPVGNPDLVPLNLRALLSGPPT